MNLLLYGAVLAQLPPVNNATPPVIPGSPPVGPVGTFNLVQLAPFGNCDFQCIADRIANFLLVIGVPLVAIMTLVGAFYMITAGGSSERFMKGQKTLLYAAVGFVVLLVAKSVAALIKGIFNIP